MDKEKTTKNSKKRQDNEAPVAVAEYGWRYHHVGIPCTVPRKGEQYLKQFNMFVSGFSESPYGIEWVRFGADCPLPDMIKNVPHVAFEVDDLDKALKGKKILLKPGVPSDGARSAMIVHNDAPVELIEFK